MPTQTDQSVQTHYTAPDLATTLLNALRAAGKNPDQLQPQDLWPVDQFHTRGIDASRELAALAGVRQGETVLDVGGGMGGSARLLASGFGCDVTVLDLTPEFIHAGEELTARVHLADRVHFRQGNALDLPFEADSFDLVWTQHSTMNIPNKPQLYREISRVLKPGGRLAMHEILAGPVQPVLFPVPWATVPEISFLLTPEETRAVLHQVGFVEQAWVDQTAVSAEFYRQRAAAAASGEPPPLGLHLVLRDSYAPGFRNLTLNVAQDRLRVAAAVLAKPA